MPIFIKMCICFDIDCLAYVYVLLNSTSGTLICSIQSMNKLIVVCSCGVLSIHSVGYFGFLVRAWVLSLYSWKGGSSVSKMLIGFSDT